MIKSYYKTTMGKVVIIGSGVGGLGAACLLAKAGHSVTLLEKNSDLGGRGGQFKENGFTFCYGPSWYLMPEVFERFFGLLGKDISKELKLKRLSPSYRVFFNDSLLAPIDISSNLGQDMKTFELTEPGAGKRLKEYLSIAEENYKLAKEKFIYKNYDSWRDLAKPSELLDFFALSPFTNFHKSTERFFASPRLQQILEFPTLFLGSNPFNTPATYGLLNHTLLNQGAFYPEGGMYSIIDRLIQVAEEFGVEIETDRKVKKINAKDDKIVGITLESGKKIAADVVISNAGLAQTKLELLPRQYRSYSRRRKLRRKKYSPSAVLLFLGIKGDLPQLAHHNLILDSDWRKQFSELSRSRRFPSRPSIYLCNPSRDDNSLTPYGHQSLFAIIPIANNVPYTDSGLEAFVDKSLKIVSKNIHIDDLKPRIVYRKIFGPKDFADRYGAYQNTMLGLSHTLWQTGPFRPQNKSKKVKNLYYVGADTVPGVGMPICLISAELVAQRINTQR